VSSGQELYTDLFEKAAALMESLIDNHPCVDGNKRTGIASTVLFLKQNGISFSAKNPELEKFTLRLASCRIALPEMVKWLKSHSD